MTIQLPKVGIKAPIGQSLNALQSFLEATESHLVMSSKDGWPVDPQEFSLLAKTMGTLHERVEEAISTLEEMATIPHARTRVKALTLKVQGLLEKMSQVQALLGISTNVVKKRVFPTASSPTPNDKSMGAGGRVVDGALVKGESPVTGTILDKTGVTKALSGALQGSEEALSNAIATFNNKGLLKIEANTGGALVNGLSVGGSDGEGNPLSIESLVAEDEGGTRTLLGPSINGQGNEWSNKDLAFAPVRARTLQITFKGKPNGQAFLETLAPKLYDFVGEGSILEGEHSFPKGIRSLAIAESSTAHDLSRYFEVIHTITVDGQSYELGARDDEWTTLPKLLWFEEGGSVPRGNFPHVLVAPVKGEVKTFRHRASIRKRENLDEAALEALLGNTATPHVVEFPKFKAFKETGYAAPPLRLSSLRGGTLTGWGLNRLGIGEVIPETLEIPIPQELAPFIEQGRCVAYVGGQEVDIDIDGSDNGEGVTAPPTTGARVLKGKGGQSFLKFAASLKGETFCPRVNVPTYGTIKDDGLSLTFPGCYTGLRGGPESSPSRSEGIWAKVSDPKVSPSGPAATPGQITLSGASTFTASATVKVPLKSFNLTYLEALGESGIYEVSMTGHEKLPTTIETIRLYPSGTEFTRKAYRADGSTLDADYTYSASALSGRCLLRLPRGLLVGGATVEVSGKRDTSSSYAIGQQGALQVSAGEVLLKTYKVEGASASLRSALTTDGMRSWTLPEDAILGTVSVKGFEMLKDLPEREKLPLLELERHSQTTASGVTTTRFVLPSSHVDEETLTVRRLDTGEVLDRADYETNGFNLYVESVGTSGIAEISVTGEILYLPATSQKVAWVEGRTVFGSEPMTFVTYARHPYEVFGHHLQELPLKKAFEGNRLMVSPATGAERPEAARTILFYRGYSKGEEGARSRADISNGILTLLPSYFVLECHFA